jgi:hypothetical protein
MGPAQHQSHRAERWDRYKPRSVRGASSENGEISSVQDMQMKIQRLRGLDFHLPFTTRQEGQGLSDLDLQCIIHHTLADWRSPSPARNVRKPRRCRRIGMTKVVVEARDPHDSPGVEAARQRLLEDFAGTVFQDRVGDDHPVRGRTGRPK